MDQSQLEVMMNGQSSLKLVEQSAFQQTAA
jgi:hypothetical protein